MDKNTKILIPEISGDWKERTRSGNTNIWNYASNGVPHRNGLPEVRLDPPEVGLYAERIDDAWYWVSGCAQCNGAGERWSYIVCDKHDVCRRCSIHRSKLTETPWGHTDGWTCKPCQDAEDAQAKATALAKVAEGEYDEWDYRCQDECKCPHCATVIHIESEDYGDKKMECDTCGGQFELTTEYSVTFTTQVIGERITA
ncbi:hypothetical protein PS943_05855 [Pseudomonas fluorescens]|uniref:Prophage PssSM-02 n=1 Tax=Pseudomonas fluorescens TaxID=294 RepID=A0A5E7WTI0_PSEFL|nr:hypothetical protein [Pseudomonas fluorescens]VVQ38412.1 hypothetical protein PS943_05855 [Pseudomonas fluorescens]